MPFVKWSAKPKELTSWPLKASQAKAYARQKENRTSPKLPLTNS